MKQRREKVLQNAKDRKLAKGNPLVALQANRKVNSALNDTQSTNDEIIDDNNTDAVIDVENIDNAAIDAEDADNVAIDAENIDNAAIDAEDADNVAIDAENIDNAAINADNTSNAATDRSDDVTMSNNNTDNAPISASNTDNATTCDGNMDNASTGKTSTVQVPLSPCYGRKTKDPSKIKTSTKHMPTIAEPLVGDPPPDEIATLKASGYTFDPTDVRIYEFLIQGAPNPLDLEGIEEDQLLEIQ